MKLTAVLLIALGVMCASVKAGGGKGESSSPPAWGSPPMGWGMPPPPAHGGWSSPIVIPITIPALSHHGHGYGGHTGGLGGLGSLGGLGGGWNGGAYGLGR